jgi:hypothetical protein
MSRNLGFPRAQLTGDRADGHSGEKKLLAKHCADF